MAPSPCPVLAKTTNDFGIPKARKLEVFDLAKTGEV
jgi:hypothetical protein